MSIRSLTGAVVLVLAPTWMAAAQQPPVSAEESQQQPPVTFRVEVNYVEVDAAVTDASGHPVTDLRLEDFEVLEDGQPQEVVDFALVDLPLERAEQPLFADAPLEPDVETNVPGVEGRLYVLVLDDLHTSVLRSQLVQAAAREFVERHLGANDLMAVVHTSGRPEGAQEFTNSRRRLLAAIDHFQGRKSPASVRERIDEYYRHLSREAIRPRVGDAGIIDDMYDFERVQNATSTLRTLRNIADLMNGVRGRRKALVMISEGIEYDIANPFSGRYTSAVLEDVREAIGAATRASLTIYTLDPRGLTQLGDEVIELQAFPDDPRVGLGPETYQQLLRATQDSLRTLSEQTGGIAIVDTNDMAEGIARIVRDNSSYYLLGYYSSNDRRDGRFRRIEVRVRRPGVAVRARQGYAAPRGGASTRGTSMAADASAALREVLSSPLPVSGLRLHGFVAPFRASARDASVLVGVHVEGSDLRFAERGGQFHNSLEVALAAIDSQGKTHGSTRQTFDLALRPETHRAVVERGFRMLFRLELPRGRYQVRTAVRESGGGVGSVHASLDVDDFDTAPLVASGIVLTSTTAGLTPTARLDEQLRDVLPGPPTAIREFGRDETLVLFVEIYDNQGARSRTVDIRTRILGADGRVLAQSRDERSSDELEGARGGYGHIVDLPLESFAPGLYVLRVEAASRLDPDVSISREIPFRVR